MTGFWRRFGSLLKNLIDSVTVKDSTNISQLLVNLTILFAFLHSQAAGPGRELSSESVATAAKSTRQLTPPTSSVVVRSASVAESPVLGNVQGDVRIQYFGLAPKGVPRRLPLSTSPAVPAAARSNSNFQVSFGDHTTNIGNASGNIRIENSPVTKSTVQEGGEAN
jgi:hypothetical protein